MRVRPQQATMYRHRETLCLGFFFLWKFCDLLLLGLGAFLQVFVLCFLGLRLMSLSLANQLFLASLGCLKFVDVFHESPLVFEHSLPDLQVQAVLHVNLRFTESPEKLTWDPNPHLSYILQYPNIGSMLPSAYVHMTALPPGQGQGPGVGASSIQPRNGQSQASGPSAHL